jgi:hypothetical protein
VTNLSRLSDEAEAAAAREKGPGGNGALCALNESAALVLLLDKTADAAGRSILRHLRPAAQGRDSEPGWAPTTSVEHEAVGAFRAVEAVSAALAEARGRTLGGSGPPLRCFVADRPCAATRVLRRLCRADGRATRARADEAEAGPEAAEPPKDAAERAAAEFLVLDVPAGGVFHLSACDPRRGTDDADSPAAAARRLAVFVRDLVRRHAEGTLEMSRLGRQDWEREKDARTAKSGASTARRSGRASGRRRGKKGKKAKS